MKIASTVVVFLVAVVLVAPSTAQMSPGLWDLPPAARPDLLQQSLALLRSMNRNQASFSDLQMFRMSPSFGGLNSMNMLQMNQLNLMSQIDPQSQTGINMAAQQAALMGAQQATNQLNVENREKRYKMAEEALEGWERPKTFRYKPAPYNKLVDPFFDVGDSIAAQSRALDQVTQGSCLEIDSERQLARVGSSCSADPCFSQALPGDYPFLEDGTPIVDPESLAVLRASCKGKPYMVVRGDSVALIAPVG